MLKQTIKFKDLDGKDVEEDFYFHLGNAELADLELSYEGGLSKHLERIVQANDGAQIMATLRELLRRSIGRRSEDGRRFEKSDPNIWLNFYESDAYDVFFMQLATDAEASIKFIKGIVPLELAKEFPTVLTPLVEEVDTRPAWEREDREPTELELTRMSRDELKRAYARKLGSDTSIPD